MSECPQVSLSGIVLSPKMFQLDLTAIIIYLQFQYNVLLFINNQLWKNSSDSPGCLGTAEQCNFGCQLVLSVWNHVTERDSSQGRGLSSGHSWRDSRALLPELPKTPWTLRGGPRGSGRTLAPQSLVIFHNLQREEQSWLNECHIYTSHWRKRNLNVLQEFEVYANETLPC